VTNGASGDCTNVPRCVDTLNFGPMIACAAVEPRQMMTRGWMIRFQPRTTRRDLGGVRFFVDAFLAARLPLEVLHDVGHVDLRAVDARFFECFVE
jgi:hypothetical protein